MIKENPSVSSNSYIENILKSNSATLKFFMANNLRSLQDELNDIISNKIFQDKMRLLFKYYKPRGNEDMNTLANKKFLNRYGMTKTLSDLIFSNLHLEQTLELVEIYFQSDIEGLQKLLKREEFMKIMESDPNTMLHFTGANISEYQAKFKHHIERIQEQILDVYYDERINLLKLCYMFMTISLKDRDPISISCAEVFNKINKDNGMLKNFWEIFKSYTADFRICKNIEDMPSKEKHSLQILKEQGDILDNIMFLTVKIERAKMTKEMFLDMLFTFSSKQFMGYFYEIANEHHLEDYHRRQQRYAEMLIDQSLLLILFNIDLKYLFYFDNKIKIHDNVDTETLNTDRLPLSLFKTDVDKLLKFLEDNYQYNFVMPINIAFVSIFNLLRDYIEKGLIKDNQLLTKFNQIKNHELLNFNDEKRNLMMLQCAVDFINSMFNRVIFSQERLSFHSFYKFVIKFWLNIVIKYYLEYAYDLSFVELCVKTLDDEITNIIFWSVDEPNKTPLAKLYENIIANFPFNFDFLLLFSNAIKGTKSTSFYSSKIFDKLSNLQFINVECRKNEIGEFDRENRVILIDDKKTEWGLTVPSGTKGWVIQKHSEGYLQVRFEYSFSLFGLIYYRWASLIDTLYEIPSHGNWNVKDLISSGENSNVQFISLFCNLISENNSNLDMFLGLFKKSEQESEFYMTEDEIFEQYKKLLSFCFETLSLLSKNWQLYRYLFPLSNSIYRMIVSFLHNPRINNYILTVINNNFVSNFEGMSRGEYYNQSININIPTRGHFKNYPFQSKSPVMINLIEILGSTISYDFGVKNFDNTVMVLKIVKHFFKYPNILEFVRNINSVEFLYNLWQYIVVEFLKTLFSTEYFTLREEFDLCKEVVKIIYNNLKIISVSNGNKANILVIDPSSQNILHELILSCLNLFETSELILRILKTKVVIDQRETVLKDKISINNFLWENFISSGNNFYIDKLKVKNLIRVAFQCLNQIFDLVILYKTTTDDALLKFYSRIDTIKFWDEIFFVSKILPYYDSIGSENYSINLILSILSYVDFEDKVLLDFQQSHNKIFPDDELEMDEDSEEILSERKVIKFDELISHRKKEDNDYNICTLSINTMNRIIMLLKLQSEFSNVNATTTLTSSQMTKSSNLVNYFYLKKENSSELENSINLFDKFKEIICLLLLKPYNFSFKIEIIKFLTQCAAYQTNFISLFFDEIKLRNLKSKKFWEIFAFLISGKVPHATGNESHIHLHEMQNEKSFKHYEEMLGYLTILVSWIFTNDVIFKKTIKDLLTSFKSDFDNFLNKSIEVFSLNDTETKLKSVRKTYRKNQIGVHTKCNDLVFVEEEFTEACFENIVNKSLAIIFSKLILISDQSLKLPNMQNKFNYYKELIKFLSGNVSNFIDSYVCRLNYDFLINFNFLLADEKSFLNHFEREEEIGLNRSRSLHSYSKYTQNYNIKDNAINIKNIEKIITNNEDKYFLPFTIDPHSGVFNYSINYWIDIKELYIEMKIRNYNVDIFLENINNFIEHNLEMSLFEAKTQTFHSVSYLLGLIFSIGIGNNFMSSYVFTGNKVFHAINQMVENKEFAEQILSLNNSYPKLGFNLFSELSMSEFVKIIDEKIVRKIELDLSFYNSSGSTDFSKRDHYSIRNLPNFNFYNQYIAYKFNILNFVFDHCIYLLNNREDRNFHNFPVSLFQKHANKFLEEIDRNFPTFLNNSSQFEIEKCILYIVNLIFTLMTYLNISEYEFQESEIICINSIINSLIVCYEKIPAYQAIIIFILNSYSSINYFTNRDNQNNQLNVLFNTQDHRLIRTLLKKLSTKITEQEYLAIITLLISLVDNNSQTLEIIVKDKIMLVFQLNDKFSNSIGINEYQENERGVNHILWCWTLVFLRQICLKLIDIESDNMRYYSIYHSIVDFILNHEARFMSVLCNSDYFDNSGNHIHKSLAFLEELEYMTSLINSLFYQSKRWKHTSQIYLEFYNRFVSVLLSKTIKIYSPNIRIANHFRCFSNVEKKMNEIFASDIGVGMSKYKDERMEKLTKDEHYTTTFSPVKRNLRGAESIQAISSLSPRKESLSSSRPLNYNTMVSTMFFYRVDNVLTKILYNLTNIIKSAVIHDNYSNKISFGFYLKELYGSRNQAGASNLKYFDEKCQNMVYALYYAIHTLDSLIKNFSIIHNLHKKSIILFNNVNSSVNFGNLNLIYNEGRFDDIFHMNNCTIQNILLINLEFNQLLNYFRTTTSHSFDTQLKEVTLRKIGLIEKIMKERDLKIETLKDFSSLNFDLFDHVKRFFD